VETNRPVDKQLSHIEHSVFRSRQELKNMRMSSHVVNPHKVANVKLLAEMQLDVDCLAKVTCE